MGVRAGGFFHSGDLFEIAPEDPRFYRIRGRCKDLIVRGGMKLSPEELDTRLQGHPMVSDAAVVGYPDDDLGERMCAVVVPKEGAVVTLADMADYLSGLGVARFKLPERIVATAELPRNPLGKLVRGDLKQLASAGGNDGAGS